LTEYVLSDQANDIGKYTGDAGSQSATSHIKPWFNSRNYALHYLYGDISK